MTLVTTFAQNSWNFLYISGKGFLAGSRALFFEEAKSSPPLPTHPRSFSAPGADSSRICSSILISGKPGVHDLRAFAIVHRRLWRMCEWIGMPGWALYQSLYCLPVRRSVVITCRRLSTTMKRWSICWPPSAPPPPPHASVKLFAECFVQSSFLLVFPRFVILYVGIIFEIILYYPRQNWHWCVLIVFIESNPSKKFF